HSALRILLVAALAACGGSDGPRGTVTIPTGAYLDAAIDSLAANHVISRPGLFRWYAKVTGLGGSLKSGVYLLRQNESWSDVVGALERGRGGGQAFTGRGGWARGGEQLRTVREGCRLVEVADLAWEGLRIRRDSFIAAARYTALLSGLGV